MSSLAHRMGFPRPTGGGAERRRSLGPAGLCSVLLLSACALPADHDPAGAATTRAVPVANSAERSAGSATDRSAEPIWQKPDTTATASPSAPRQAGSHLPADAEREAIIEPGAAIAPAGEAAADPAGGGTDGLIGLDESEVRARFGPPASEEDGNPAKTWHYRDARCAVDIVLYPDIETRAYKTLTYEVTGDGSTAEAKRLCLANLRARAGTRPDAP